MVKSRFSTLQHGASAISTTASGPTRATAPATTANCATGPSWPGLLERGLFDGLFIADILGVGSGAASR